MATGVQVPKAQKEQKTGKAKPTQKAATIRPSAKPRTVAKRAPRQVIPSAMGKALQARIDADKISVSAAARAIGVNAQGLVRILNQGADPNARTAKRYARWLKHGAAAPAEKTVAPGKVTMPPAGTDRFLRMPLARILRLATLQAEAKASKPAKASKAEAAILHDKLALAVHQASAKNRRIVALVVGAVP